MNKLLVSIAIVAVVAVIVGGVLWHNYEPAEADIEVSGIPTGDQVDLIGTRVGTTTTGVAFPNFSVVSTTTYPIAIESYVDTATFYFQATAASTTAQGAGYMNFRFIASNDYACDTATTSAYVSNYPEIEDIDWYDIGMNLANTDGSTTLTSTTTPFAWTINHADINTTLTFTNLNARCLAVQAQGTSSAIYVGIITKSQKEY